MRSVIAVAAIAAALILPSAASADHASSSMRLVTTLSKRGDLSPPPAVLASANSDLRARSRTGHRGRHRRPSADHRWRPRSLYNV
jgi:hypothetical protein